MTEVHQEARHRGVDLVVLPTPQAIGVLTSITKQTNASGTASRNAVMSPGTAARIRNVVTPVARFRREGAITTRHHRAAGEEPVGRDARPWDRSQS